MHHKPAIALSLAYLLSFSSFAQDQKSESDRQAEKVGAPEVSKAEQCEDLVVKRVMPGPGPAVSRSKPSGWVVIAYDLDGSGDAKNVSVLQESSAGEFSQYSVAAVRARKFAAGVLRIGCKARMTYSVG